MSLFSDQAAEPGKPYWSEHGEPTPDLSTQLPQHAELLIVGAGYTGLSAAIAAHDAGAKVVVVDAGIPGIGASSRNGGMFGAHPRLGFQTLVKLFGESAAVGIFNEAQEAFDFSSDLIARENIQCHFEKSGRIQLAWTNAHLDSQKEQVKSLGESTNMNLEFMERSELASEINTGCYFGGIRFPDHASLHPRQFHDGLIAACLNRDIDIVQRCPIDSVVHANGKHLATSRDGKQMRADKVILATNGYTSGKFGWFTRRVFPLPSYLIATEPLSRNLVDYLAPGKRMMVETRARHSYFRVSPDGSRFIFGGRASMQSIPLERAAQRLKNTMCQVWPELSDVKLTHCWSGNTGYTFNHMPHVGEHQGIHYAMGFSGSGTALAPYLGSKVAYSALGDDRGETAYKKSTLKTHWIHPGRNPVFLKAVDHWYHSIVDRRESRRARVDEQSQ